MGRRVGVSIVGAYGAVATCVAVGTAALRRGLAAPRGMVTALPFFARCPLADPADLILAGHDIRETTLVESARELAVTSRLFDAALLDRVTPDLAEIDARIRPGTSLGAGKAVIPWCSPRVPRGETPAAALARLRADLASFRASERLDALVVVNLASAEPEPAGIDATLGDAARVEAAFAGGTPVPASVVHAAAAALEGCAFINFTSSTGAHPAGVDALFRTRRLPHAGRDGKTGETLLKTALAPMFLARNLRVLGWGGFNVLGNRDGEVLADPEAARAKIRHKEDALRALLGDPEAAVPVRIDHIPALGDWKTALDYIHFEGFLGARMSLSFVWTGSDSLLAAPLVIDLVRLADLAIRRGESGPMRHCASFFKDPLGSPTHDFFEQLAELRAYALRAGEAP